MNKKQLTERDICTKYITPALESLFRHSVGKTVSDDWGDVCGRNCGRNSASAQGQFWNYMLI